MNPLYLSGFGVSLNVDRARLQIKDGVKEPDVEPERFTAQPRNPHFDSVIIDGHSGNITLDAMKWLMRHNIPLFILDYNGSLLSSTLPREPVNGPLKVAQIETYKNTEKRFYIAKKLIEVKIQRTLDVINWIASRYDVSAKNKQIIHSELQTIDKPKNRIELLTKEARVAETYWKILYNIFPKQLCFNSRIRSKHQNNASDPINVLLNYGYSFLETQCRKTLNTVGLEPTIGFLHETKQVKYSLTYDLQEPFRWLIDTTVISCIENQEFNRKDFYRMDNYVLRLRPESVKRFLDLLRIKFNSSAFYKDKNYCWDTIIQLKTQELARFINGKSKQIEFDKPHMNLLRTDDTQLRKKILELSQKEARELGIKESTLHYLRKHARDDKPFKVYQKVSVKLK
ncbi:CRISPR-associated endonuclease Cas1 [Thermoproteota archaeon]